jgi:hypothetical protein
MFESAGFKPAFFRLEPVVGVLQEQVPYVATESTNPLPPYTSWAISPPRTALTAHTQIQNNDGASGIAVP